MRPRRARRWAPARGRVCARRYRRIQSSRLPIGFADDRRDARRYRGRGIHQIRTPYSSGSPDRGHAARGRTRRLDDAVDHVRRRPGRDAPRGPGRRCPRRSGPHRSCRSTARAVPSAETPTRSSLGADTPMRDALRRRLDARPALRVHAGDRQHARGSSPERRHATCRCRGCPRRPRHDVVLERIEEGGVPALVPVRACWWSATG